MRGSMLHHDHNIQYILLWSNFFFLPTIALHAGPISPYAIILAHACTNVPHFIINIKLI